VATESAGTILVVEGDPSLQALLRDLLSGEGYRVILAADGEQSLRLAEHHRPDAILLDVDAPPMSGAEALARLVRHDATARIPVIALTGQSSPPKDDARRPDAWIGKPFEIDVLLEQVGRVAGPPARSRTPAKRVDHLWSMAPAGGA
jgi:CheY-like chemotaxis protein